MGLLNKFRPQSKRKGLEQEVADHLTALFNTKQSFGAWQRGFGMKNYTNGKFKDDLIADIIQDIKYNIENFEKRIKIIEIEALEETDIFKTRFQIRCRLGSTFHSFYIGFKQSQESHEVEVIA